MHPASTSKYYDSCYRLETLQALPGHSLRDGCSSGLCAERLRPALPAEPRSTAVCGASTQPPPLHAAAAKSLQSCPTLCHPIDASPPGSPVPGILQARTLERVAISFNAWKWKVKVKSLSRVRLLATPWTAAHQAPPSMGFSRQEYWSGVPLPPCWGSPKKHPYPPPETTRFSDRRTKFLNWIASFYLSEQH